MQYALYDIESASLKGGICELAVGYVDTSIKGKIKMDVIRCKPDRGITFEAMGTHFITRADVTDKPLFKETDTAAEFTKFTANKDNIVIGYNNSTFDDIIVQAESDVKLKCKKIDLYRVLEHMRFEDTEDKHQWPDNIKLPTVYFWSGAYRLFDKKKSMYGVDELIPHQAQSDIIMTHLIMSAIISKFKLKTADLIKYTYLPIIFEVFPIGKHKGIPIQDIIGRDKGYIDWCLKTMSGDLLESIKHHQKLLDQQKKK